MIGQYRNDNASSGQNVANHHGFGFFLCQEDISSRKNAREFQASPLPRGRKQIIEPELQVLIWDLETDTQACFCPLGGVTVQWSNVNNNVTASAE